MVSYVYTCPPYVNVGIRVRWHNYVGVARAVARALEHPHADARRSGGSAIRGRGGVSLQTMYSINTISD